MGIRGNELADRAAKAALNQQVLPFRVPCSDFKPLIYTFVQNVWQSYWDDLANDTNKLRSIKSVLGDWLPSQRACLREELISARLRIDHSYLTHSYKFTEGRGGATVYTLFRASHYLSYISRMCRFRANPRKTFQSSVNARTFRVCET